MKKILSIFLSIFALISCHHSGEPEAVSRRTVLVYMEARNDLNSTSDINEMLRAEIPADCRLLVYYSQSASAPQLIEIKKGVKKTLKTYPDDASAVDPAQMATVIADARRAAPAGEFGIVMWSHSSGWMQTRSKSLRGFGYENLAKMISISDLAAALKGQNIDFIFFDSCYMACVEVAYELRDCARYLVASVCEVPGPGMTYDLTLPALFRSDMVGGLKEAINITVDGYIAARESCPSTLSLIDLSKMDALAATVKANQKPLPEGYDAQRFSLANPYQHLFFDFGQYLEAIDGDMSALSATVLHSRHSAKIWGEIALERVSGLSVYLPELSLAHDYSSYGYSTLQWYNQILQ